MLPSSDPPPPSPPSPPRRCRPKWAIYAFVSSCVGCIIWAAALAMAGHRKAAVIMAATAGSSLMAFPWVAIFFNMVRSWHQERSTTAADSSDSSTESAPEPSTSDPSPTLHLDASTQSSLKPSHSNPALTLHQDDLAPTSSSPWTSFYDNWPPFSSTQSKRYVSAPLPRHDPDLGPTLLHNESARSASRESHVAPAGIQAGGPTGDEIQLSTSSQLPPTPRSPRTGHSVRAQRSPHQLPGASSS